MIDRDLVESSWSIAQLASALGMLTPWFLTSALVLWLIVFCKLVALWARERRRL